jgi:hypothetical protein
MVFFGSGKSVRLSLVARKEYPMFTLWLNGDEFAFTPQDCERVLDMLRKVMAGQAYVRYYINCSPPPAKGAPKRYKRVFFRFCKGWAETNVPKKDWPKLAAALEAGARGEESRYAVGYQFISARAEAGETIITPDLSSREEVDLEVDDSWPLEVPEGC